MARTAKKKPKNTYHHGDLRGAILDVATGIVRRHGPSELAVRSVAEQLGVTHAAIYHHFEGRADLLVAVAERGFDELGRAMDRAMSEQNDALMAYRAQGLSYVRFAVNNPQFFGLMFTAETGRQRPRSLAAAAERLLDRIRSAIVACQNEGVLDAGTPDEHTLFCWSAVHGLASLIVAQQLSQLRVPDDLEARAGLVVDRIFTGLGTR